MTASNACSIGGMGADNIHYFLFLYGRWRWRPTARMRRAGLSLVTMGKGGPGLNADGNPLPSAADMARAIVLNEQWDKVRRGEIDAAQIPTEIYPPRSVGEGYQRAMALREAERKSKGITWTKEQTSRDDWPRAWKWLKPVFADVSPTDVQPEHFLSVDIRTGKMKGLLPKIEAKVSKSERHRVVKVWRALWKKMAALDYCKLDADPSMMLANTAPMPRQDTWRHREVLRHVQRAWRMGYPGLAACLAVAWDSMLSPVDARRLTVGQLAQDDSGSIFFLDRAKTGRAAAGTLTPWSLALLGAYLNVLKTDGIELLDNAPIFRTKGASTGPKGGRRWLPQPYSKNKLGRDFRIVRAAINPNDKRQVADLRRSGAVEGLAGGASLGDAGNKMANTLAANSRLQKTYTPVNIASVLRFDAARVLGKRLLREQGPNKSVINLRGKVS